MLNKIYNFFLIIAILLTILSSEKLKITAELSYARPKTDSLIIFVNLQNHSNKSLFLVCKVNQIDIEPETTVLVNYNGSAEDEFENLKKEARVYIEAINKNSSVNDTFYLTLPKVKKQFQENYLGDKVDIYDRINKLEEAYYVLRRNKHAPDPPNVNDIAEYFYTDIDVYNLVRQKNINDQETIFYESVVILKPNQNKTFSINASFLLLQKATYLLSFDFKTNDTIFIEEGEILQKLGFKRFKGHITSNVIEIKSEKEVIPL